MYSDNGDNSDEHQGCREEIANLQKRLWKEQGRVARVIVEEGDQNGAWQRVAAIRYVRPTPDGLEILVS